MRGAEFPSRTGGDRSSVGSLLRRPAYSRLSYFRPPDGVVLSLRSMQAIYLSEYGANHRVYRERKMAHYASLGAAGARSARDPSQRPGSCQSRQRKTS
jgi:hypothetical protein